MQGVATALRALASVTWLGLSYRDKAVPSENSPRGPPCRCSGQDSALVLLRAQVRPLVEGLRLHKPYSVAKREKKTRKQPRDIQREVW